MDERYGIDQFIIIPSGQTVEMDIKLIDSKGTLMINENVANGIISVQEFSEEVIEFQKIEISSSNVRNGLAIAKNGTLNFDSLIVIFKPQTVATLSIQLDGLVNNGLNSDFVQKPHHLVIYSRNCLSGESYTKEGTCEKCPFGYYLIEPPSDIKPCKSCDVNAYCNGTNKLAPRPGYYRLNMSNDLIMECYNNIVCLGGNEDNMYGMCEKGYQGQLCGSCETNYTSINWRTCMECPSNARTIWNSIGLFIKVTFMVFIIWWLSVSYAETNNLRYRNFMIQIKLMINHCVILGAINEIRMNWWPTIDDYI